MSKEEKYDRQLRLWQSQGQSSLENASVLVISPTITSLELLKNLVLPNIGHFTLLDQFKLIDETDLSNNFYLNDDDLGKDKLATLTKNINELNSDVGGAYINIENGESVDEFISKQQLEYWSKFDLIIYNWNNLDLINVSRVSNIPLIILSSIGFYGFIRVYKAYFEVVDTHPDSLIDLRILYPWKELLDYSNSIDLNSLDLEKHSQIPYLIIQLKAIQTWLNLHEKLPESSKERADFKKMIVNWKKDFSQLNFDEAVLNSNKIFNKIKIPSNVEDIFIKLKEFEERKLELNEFWTLVKTLKKFVDLNDGNLPISGELPDMDSNTENYNILKGIYKDKFNHDLSEFTKLLSQEIHATTFAIDPVTIKNFIKNSKYLFYSENSFNLLDFESFKSKIINDYNLTDYEGKYDLKPVLLSIILLESFRRSHLSFPKSINDFNLTELIPTDILSSINLQDVKNVLLEMIRSQGQEMNNISSIMGGIGAQEAIKLITSQYVPLDNLLVFDGLNSVSGKIKL